MGKKIHAQNRLPLTDVPADEMELVHSLAGRCCGYSLGLPAEALPFVIRDQERGVGQEAGLQPNAKLVALQSWFQMSKRWGAAQP